MSGPTHIVGVDLSGPGSPQHTAVAVFRMGEGLRFASLTLGATDAQVADAVPRSACVVGIDAPLSYSSTGGARPGDAALQKRAVQAGLHPGSVMAPSAPRMVYLTLRGVGLTRMLMGERPDAAVVEVHPTAALALHGAPAATVRAMKASLAARRELLVWLEGRGLSGIARQACDSDHTVAACAADSPRGSGAAANPRGCSRRSRRSIRSILRVEDRRSVLSADRLQAKKTRTSRALFRECWR